MTTPTYDRELIARMLADYMWPDKIAGRAYRVEAIQKQIDALNAADAAGVRTVNATDPMRALGFTIEDRGGISVLVYADGSCHPANDDEVAMWEALESALAQQPEAPAQEAFGHLYRIVSPQIPATRDGPWIGPGVNFEFGPPPADTPCVQYLALYTAPQPAIPEVPKEGEVLVEVRGLTGSGKSAIAGEIEILCKALGLEVRWINGDTEKAMTHADWTEALELYKPRVRIVERNVPRHSQPAQEPDHG